MKRDEFLKEVDKKKKKKKTLMYILLGIIALSLIIYNLGIFNLSKDIPQINEETECTNNIDGADIVLGTIRGIVDSDKYSLFLGILIVLGFIYLIFIAIGVLIDIIKLGAFMYISGKKIKGIFRKSKGGK